METQISIVVVLILSGVFFTLGYKKSLLGLYLLTPLVILMHKQNFSLFGVWDLLPIRLATLFLISGYFVQIYRSKQILLSVNSYKQNPFLLGFIALVGAIVLSFFNTISFQESIQLFSFLLLQVALIFIAFDLVDTHKKFFNWFNVFVYTIFGSLIFAVFQYWYFLQYGKPIGALWYIPGVYVRLGSLFWDVNHYGAFLVAGLFMTFSYFLLAKGYKKYFSLFTSIFIIPILILTNSRSSWGGAFVGAIIYAILLYINGYKKFIISSLLSLLILIISVFSYIEIKTDFSFTTWYANYTHTRLDSSESHMILIKKAWEVFKEHQIIGGGYGNFNEQLRTLNAKDNEYYFLRDPGAAKVRVPSHSIWGQMLSETGLLGFGIFTFLTLIIVFSLLRLSISQKDVFASGLLASLLSTLASGIFYSYNLEFFWWIYMFSIVYVVITSQVKVTFVTIFDWVKANSWIIFLLIALYAGFYIFLGLGTNALIDYDEAIYAKVSKNIVDGKGIATLYWNIEQAWFEKPPLYMWLTAPLLKITSFALSSWAVRFWSAIFGFGTVLLTYLFAKKKFGLFAGIVSAVALTTTVQFLYYSKLGMLDVSITFFITSALYVYVINKKSILNSLLIGGLIGLGVMTKAIVGLLPIGIIVVYELLLIYSKQKKLSEFANQFLIIIVGLLVCVLPWHYYETVKFGQEFWNSYFIKQIFERGVTGDEKKSASLLWYFIVLKVSMRFWFIALIPSVFIVFVKSFTRSNIFKLLLIWAGVILVFFSISNTKLIWYIMPIYPVLAIIIGFGASEVLSLAKTRFSKNKIDLELIAVTLVILIGFYNVYLVRDRIWTPDFNKFKKVLVNTANEKYLNHLLYYVEMEEPVIRFYVDSNTQIKGVSSADIWLVYEGLSYSESMLVIAGSDVHKIFNDKGIRVIKVNEEDDYFLYDIQSFNAYEQGKVNQVKAEYNALLKDITLKETTGLLVTQVEHNTLNQLFDTYTSMQAEVDEKIEAERMKQDD